jgi:hypothetical protein
MRNTHVAWLMYIFGLFYTFAASCKNNQSTGKCMAPCRMSRGIHRISHAFATYIY